MLTASLQRHLENRFAIWIQKCDQRPCRSKNACILGPSYKRPCKNACILAPSYKRPCKNACILAPSYKRPCKNAYILAPSYKRPCKNAYILAQAIAKSASRPSPSSLFYAFLQCFLNFEGIFSRLFSYFLEPPVPKHAFLHQKKSAASSATPLRSKGQGPETQREP